MSSPTPSQEAAPPYALAAPRSASRQVRLSAAALLLACCSVLALAAWLRPSDSGVSTHTQLGFAPCGMILVTGYPCPTCGMTTAFAHAMRGRLDLAFWSQPAGLALALGTFVTACVAASAMRRGRWPAMPAWLLPWTDPLRLGVSLLLLMFGAWGFKIGVGLIDGTFPDRRVEYRIANDP